MESNQKISCPVCKETVVIKMAKGRKSGKPFLMLICGKDGRHLRAFITDQAYVKQVLDQIDNQTRG